MASSNQELNQAIDEAMRVLQPIFSRPKLRSRLLSKPPFRFIHDVVVAIIHASNFPSTFFTDAEMQSTTYKNDKDAKMEFLDKLIALVNTSRESPIDVESRNVVAGVKPAATLKLLVAFGKLAVDDSIACCVQQLTTRTEILEDEAKDDDTSDEAKAEDSFEEAKEEFTTEDNVDEEKNAEVVCKKEYMSMTDSLERIIQLASLVENLFTE